MLRFDFKNTNVLITGASSGLGKLFAEELAARGANLILVARSAVVLDQLCQRLIQNHAIKAITIPFDLTQQGACQQVYQEACKQGLTPSVVINNAGFATYGYFEKIDLARQYQEIQLNCQAIVEMTHCALPAMLQNHNGAIINVASTAAFQPDPFMAIYGASKAFVLSFSEALWAENIERGVRVLALCPGATETGFFDVVNAKEASVGKRMEPERVVKEALQALDRNRTYLITGRMNWWLALLSRVLSRRLTLLIARKVLFPQTQ